MARPFRLRYTDNDGNEQIIGRYLGDVDTNASIDQGQLKNNGSGEFTRLEIKGDKGIQSRMPFERTDFQNNLPEIILDVYSTSAGGFIERDRVYPIDTGKIESDDGEYRNDQLAGFEKYVGSQKTDTTIGPINTNLTDVLTALLEEASETYEVQTKGTIPSVTNYTFKGNIGQAIRDIHRDYPQVKLWWTGQTNSSGNQIVKLEEKGAGDVVETITWPESEDYSLVEYEENDASAVINRATVVGTDSNGNSIEVDTDDLSDTIAEDIQDSKDKYGEISLPPRNIGYLEDQAHAEEIAKNLLQLEAQPHLVIEIPFQEQNVLNASIDIEDQRYGINDVFTVVKQRDFFSDSTTQLELSFEKNSNEDRRAERRDVGEERTSIYPTQPEDVGNQNVDANTEDVTDQYDTHNSFQHPHDVAGDQTNEGGGAAASVTQDLFDSSFSIPANDTGVITTADVGTVNQQFAMYYITFRISPDREPTTSSEIQALAPTIRVRQDVSESTFYFPSEEGQVLYSTAASPENSDFWNTVNYEVTIKVPNVFNDSTEEVQIETGDTAIEGVVNVTRIGEEEHEHSIQFVSDRATDRSDDSTNSTNPSDSSAGDTTSLNADGSTDPKNIDVARQNKTDRE